MYFDRIGDQDLIGFFYKDSIGYRSGVTKLGKERDWSATTKKRDRVQLCCKPMSSETLVAQGKWLKVKKKSVIVEVKFRKRISNQRAAYTSI
jgi:hypothetical protein